MIHYRKFKKVCFSSQFEDDEPMKLDFEFPHICTTSISKHLISYLMSQR